MPVVSTLPDEGWGTARADRRPGMLGQEAAEVYSLPGVSGSTWMAQARRGQRLKLPTRTADPETSLLPLPKR